MTIYRVLYKDTMRCCVSVNKPPTNSNEESKLKQIHVTSCDEEQTLKANSLYIRYPYSFCWINVAFVFVYCC